MEFDAAILETLLSYWQWIEQLDYTSLLKVCAVALVPLWFLLFVIKTIVIGLLRQLGLALPWSYSRFPSFLPWRALIVRPLMKWGRWKEHVFKIGKAASGGFSGIVAALSSHYNNPKTQIPLGLPWIFGFSTFQTIALEIKTHLLCIGQSGSGKSVWLKTVVGCWLNSIYLIDPKNDITREILSCKHTHKVVVLAPYGNATGQVNPLDSLHEAYLQSGESEAVKWAYRIGQSFIETPPQSKQPFFTDTARGYLVGLILFVYAHYPESERHLGTVRDLITYGMQVFNDDDSEDTSREEAFALLHKMMMESEVFTKAIAGAASPFINAGKEALGSLRATLQERTKVLDIPGVRDMLSATTRPLRELKTHNDYALVFCAEISSLRQELQDVQRLITNMVFYTFEAEPIKNGQCLVVLEEFTSMGYNSCVEVALPYMRSLGASVLAIIQDVEALKVHFPTAMSFIGNSDATVWFSTAHPDNLSLLSQLLGKALTFRKDKQTGKTQKLETDVATPDQLARFLTSELGNIIVTRSGKRALRLRLDPHYKTLPFWKFKPNPEFKEPLLRRITRALLSPLFTPRKEKTHEQAL